MMQQQLHGYYATAYCKLWVCFTVHFPQTAITFFHISANPIALSKSLLQHLKRRNHTTFRKKIDLPTSTWEGLFYGLTFRKLVAGKALLAV